jgi:LacI family transcriptional regulator
MRGKSFTVGVVLAELASPFQPEVAEGIGSELRHGPYLGMIVEGGVTSSMQRRAIEALLDRQVDGLVLVAPWVEVSWLEAVAQRVPIVTVALHGQTDYFDTVVDDERLGAQLMVDHLVDLGHRAITHTSHTPADIGAEFALSHTAREMGFEQAMRRYGLIPDVIRTYYSEEGGYRAGLEALSRKAPPTAIFAGADVAAFGVMRAAEELGLRIPEDLTVVGYDNIAVTGITRLSLTTIDQSGLLTGAAAANLLLERMNGRTTPSRYVIPPRLIVRATSGPVDVSSDREALSVPA